MKNFDLREFLNDNPLLKEVSEGGKHISELEPNEKFTFNGTEVEVHTLEQTAEDLSKVLENNQELKNALLRAIQEAGINPKSKAKLLDALNNYDVLKQLGQFAEEEIQKAKSDTNELKGADALRQTVELGAIFGTTFGSITGNVPLAAAGGILLLTALILAPKDEDDSIDEEILSEGNCPNCGASGQSGQWTGMYCKRCKYAA